MAVGPVIEGKATRDVWFEVNGEVRAVAVEDKNSAVETFTREKATPAPGSVGAPMSGVVVEVRVKEGQEVKKGDVLCVQSAMKVCNNFPGSFYVYPQWERDYKIPSFLSLIRLLIFSFETLYRWNLLSARLFLVISNVSAQKKVWTMIQYTPVAGLTK